MQSQQIKMTDGKFARTHEELVSKWQEHFQSVLNCLKPTVTHDWSNAQTSTQLPVNMDAISEAEVTTAVKQLKNGKAAGVDNIQSELLKTADSTIPYLTRVCNMMWQPEVAQSIGRMESSFRSRRKGI